MQVRPSMGSSSSGFLPQGHRGASESESFPASEDHLMPIRPENREFYRGAAYEALRTAVRDRAGNRCEHCRVPNGERVFFTWTNDDPHMGKALWWNGEAWVTREGKDV